MADFIFVSDSGKKGKGLFAGKDFKIGDRVYSYKEGKLVKSSDISHLSEFEKDHLDLVDEGLYEIMEEPARFVNHSCDPNMLEMDRIGYAIKNIKKGDELTTDYRIRAFDSWVLDCECGSENCGRRIEGNFFLLPHDLQLKYLEYAPQFIQRKYKELKRKT